MGLTEVKLDDSELQNMLSRMRRAGQDTAPIMAGAAEMLVSAVSDRYESEGDGEWPPHAEPPEWLPEQWKVGPHGLMQLSGILAGSTQADSGADFAEANTAIDYVKYHLEGGNVIPKRNPFELREEVFQEAADFIAEEMAIKVQGAA